MDDFYRGFASSDDPKKRGIVERYAAAARIGSSFSAAPRVRKMVDVAKLERCCLCSLHRRPRPPPPAADPASQTPPSWWMRVQRILMIPVDFLNKHRFFAPLRDFFCFVVPGHLLSYVVDRFNLTWRFGVGLVLVPLVTVLILDYFYPPYDSFDDEEEDEDDDDEGSDSEVDALKIKAAHNRVKIVQPAAAAFPPYPIGASSGDDLDDIFAIDDGELIEFVDDAKFALGPIGSPVIEPIANHDPAEEASAPSLAVPPQPAAATASSPLSAAASQPATSNHTSSDSAGSESSVGTIEAAQVAPAAAESPAASHESSADTAPPNTSV